MKTKITEFKLAVGVDSTRRIFSMMCVFTEDYSKRRTHTIASFKYPNELVGRPMYQILDTVGFKAIIRNTVLHLPLTKEESAYFNRLANRLNLVLHGRFKNKPVKIKTKLKIYETEDKHRFTVLCKMHKPMTTLAYAEQTSLF